MALKPTLKNVLITGSPGVGKTTCVQRIIEALRDKSSRYSSIVRINGFISQELRRNFGPNSRSARIGFDIISVVNGSSCILARTEPNMPPNMMMRYKQSKDAFRFCGRYIMDLRGFEKFTLPLLRKRGQQNAKNGNPKQSIFIVDEIGKMEMFSKQFHSLVDALINDPDVIVIGTIPIKKNIHRFIEGLRQRKDSKVYTLTRENRDTSTVHITRCVFELIDANMMSHEDAEEEYDEDEEDIYGDVMPSKSSPKKKGRKYKGTNYRNGQRSGDDGSKKRFYNSSNNQSYRKKRY